MSFCTNLVVSSDWISSVTERKCALGKKKWWIWRNLSQKSFFVGESHCAGYIQVPSASDEEFVYERCRQFQQSLRLCLSWWRTELQPHGGRTAKFRDTDDVHATGGAEVSQGDAKARLLRFLGLLLPCGDDYRTEQDEDQRNICPWRHSCHTCCNQGEKTSVGTLHLKIVGGIYLTNNPPVHVLRRYPVKSSIIIWCGVTC